MKGQPDYLDVGDVQSAVDHLEVRIQRVQAECVIEIAIVVAGAGADVEPNGTTNDV